MKIHNQVPEAKMVADFVGAEFKSARFGPQTRTAVKQFNVDPKLLKSPNFESRWENKLRAEILESCRGYLSRTRNFKCFPEHTKWFRADFGHDDFERLQYIEDTQNWNDLSKGTRFVRDGCDHIFGMPKNSNPARFVRSMYRAISRGVIMPPIIVVTDPERSRLVLLEGACRSTAYYKAFKQQKIRSVSGLLGVSKDMSQWRLF